MRIEYRETHQLNENANHNLTWASKEREEERGINDENQFSTLIWYFNTRLCWWLAVKWDKGNTEEAGVHTDNGLTRLDLVDFSFFGLFVSSFAL